MSLVTITMQILWLHDEKENIEANVSAHVLLL